MKAIFLDIETSGLDPERNFPLEICVKIYELDNLHDMLCIAEYHSLISCTWSDWVFGWHEKAFSINEIEFDELKNGKSSNEIGSDLIEIFLKHQINKRNSVFICQNPSFDRVFFNKIIIIFTQQEFNLPYHWLDLASMHFIKNLAPKKINGRTVKYHPGFYTIPCSKDAIAHYYGIPPEEKPHRAINGVNHLIECFKCLWYDHDSKKEIE